MAAVVASMSRQAGPARGVAVAGTVFHVNDAKSEDGVQATRPIWDIMSACGVLVLLAGWASNTAWARVSTDRVASLLDR